MMGRVLALAAQFQAVAAGGLLLLALVAALYLARSVVLPTVLALFLMVPLNPLVQGLRRLHLPRWLAAAVVVAGLLTGLGFAMSKVVQPAATWVTQAPRNLEKAQVKIAQLLRPTGQDVAVLPAGETNSVAPTAPAVEPVAGKKLPPPPAESLGLQRLGEFVVHWTRSVMGEFAALVILLFFFLSTEDHFGRKCIGVLPGFRYRRQALKIIAALHATLFRYLLTVLLINCTLGLVMALAMGWLHMPNPLVWGVMAALLPLVPYFGALAGVIVLTAVSFTVFASVGEAVVPPLVYLGLACLEGGFATPLILGQRLALKPVAIILSVLFWDWLWGIPGAVLAVPILIVMKVVGEHVESLQPVSEFLITAGKSLARSGAKTARAK